MSEANILAVENLEKRFRVAGGLFSRDAVVYAVVNAGLTVPHRGSLGLVGESGCGKSTLARCLLRLVEPDGGRIVFEGKEVRSLAGPELRAVRRRMQMIFQDPYGSLNPRRTVAQTLIEPLRVHRLARGKAAEERVESALAEVGLPLDSRSRFPHEFSGGQRQRIGIARALILEPTFIVADEPVSALDVSVQAQVLKLLESIREKRALSMLFVSHDLGVVRHVCERVAVMYLGRIVEEGPVPEIFDRPLHPYTQMLRAASPVPDPKARFALQRVTGEIPSAMNPPPGCPFSSRCPHVIARCREEVPPLREVEAGRKAACHLLN